MTTYRVCVVSKEYRYIEVEANDPNDAEGLAWDVVCNGEHLSKKAIDCDTELFIEGESQDAASYT